MNRAPHRSAGQGCRCVGYDDRRRPHRLAAATDEKTRSSSPAGDIDPLWPLATAGRYPLLDRPNSLHTYSQLWNRRRYCAHVRTCTPEGRPVAYQPVTLVYTDRFPYPCSKRIQYVITRSRDGWGTHTASTRFPVPGCATVRRWED